MLKPQVPFALLEQAEAQMNERQFTLITDWDGRKIDGWYATEKYNGCRGYWDGYDMWTRGGNIVKLPSDFRAQLPTGIALDGEIWAGRGNYEIARIATQYGKWDDKIRFMVFDAPEYENDWVWRIRYAMEVHHKASVVSGEQLWIVAQPETITDSNHARWMADHIKANGGEGIVVRSKSPRLYERGRSYHAMRIK